VVGKNLRLGVRWCKLGSAAGAQAPSHVLVALGLGEELIEGALRIGVGKFTTEEEIGQAAEMISHAVLEVQRAMDGFAVPIAKG